MQLLTIQCEMDDGARRQIAITLPDAWPACVVYAEASRKLRERFGVLETVRSYRVTARTFTDLPAGA